MKNDKKNDKKQREKNALKKLKRDELLELLLEQTRRAEALEEQLRLKDEELKNKGIAIAEAGSIAEAAMRLNGVFEAAQQAADQYLLNIKEKAEGKSL